LFSYLEERRCAEFKGEGATHPRHPIPTSKRRSSFLSHGIREQGKKHSSIWGEKGLAKRTIFALFKVREGKKKKPPRDAIRQKGRGLAYAMKKKGRKDESGTKSSSRQRKRNVEYFDWKRDSGERKTDLLSWREKETRPEEAIRKCHREKPLSTCGRGANEKERTGYLFPGAKRERRGRGKKKVVPPPGET